MGIRLGIGGLKIGQRSGTAAVPFDWSSYWTQQYQDVLDYMTAQSIALPSNTDKLYQAQWVKSMVDGGYWAKAEILDMFSTTENMSLINWKTPGTKNPVNINDAVHEAYKGYTGDSVNGRAINLKYLPYQSVAATKDSFCVIIGNATNLMEARFDLGAAGASNKNVRIEAFNGSTHTFKPNGTTAPALVVSRGIAHIGFSIVSPIVHLIKDSFVRSKAFTTANMNELELYACGYNNFGTLAAANKQLRYVFAFSGLTPAEMKDVVEITETYLKNYSSGLMTPDDTIHTILKRLTEKTLIYGDAIDTWKGRPFMEINSAGEWVVCYRSAASHSAGGLVHLRLSNNEGTSWSDEDKLIDGTAITMPALEGGNTAMGSGVLMRCPNGDMILTIWETGGTIGNYQWRSTDNCETWVSEGRVLGNTYLMEEDYCVVGSNVYVIVRSGTGAGKVNYLYVSTDNCASYSEVSVIQSAVTNPNEGSISYLGSNTWISVVKDTNFAKTYQNISTDNGLNWTLSDITSQVGVVNKPRTKVIDGKLYLFGRKWIAAGIEYTAVWVSTDNGTTWSAAFTPEKYSFDDCGYCDMLQKTDGSFYMLSYRGCASDADIVEYTFQEV